MFTMNWKKEVLMGLAAIFLVLSPIVGIWYFVDGQYWMWESGCARVLSEVKKLNLPVGTHDAINVPSFKSNGSQSLSAQVNSAGRIVLLLKTNIGWKGNYNGYVYANAPLLPAEIITDYYGRKQVYVPNLYDAVVRKQYSPSFFAVYLDLN